MSFPVDISRACDPIYRGDAWSLAILPELNNDGSVIELSAYGTTWTAQLRATPDSTDSIPFAIDTSNVTGSINSAPTAPRLTLSLTGAQTAALAYLADGYVMDLQVTGGTSSPLTLYRATLLFVKDVTRP